MMRHRSQGEEGGGEGRGERQATKLASRATQSLTLGSRRRILTLSFNSLTAGLILSVSRQIRPPLSILGW